MVPDGGGWITVTTGWGDSDHLRVTALEASDLRPFALAEVRIGGVRAERTVRLPGAAPGHRVDVISLERDPGRPACVLVDRSTLCRDAFATTGDDGSTLDRTFSLDDPGAFGLNVAGSWTESPAVTRALARQLPFGLRTSPTASQDVRSGALAMVDADPTTTWVSATGVRRPRVRVTFDQPTFVDAVSFALSPTTPAVLPTAVTVRSGEHLRRARVEDDGSARFRALPGRRFTVIARTSDIGLDTSGGGQVPLPTGIGTLQLYGAGTPLLDAAGQEFRGRCGSGPSVTVDDDEVPTGYRATMREVMQGQVRIEPCVGSVALATGSNRVVAGSNRVLTVDRLRLSRADQGAAATPQLLSPDTWTDERRTVSVAASSSGRLLVVSQNYNDGWRATLDGERLRPQLVDGWRQGWWLPAGASGTVEMTYTPQRGYEVGLLVGALGALVVALVAAVPVRRRGRRRPRPESLPRRVAAAVGATAMVVAAGLLGGWPAAGAGAVLLLLLALVPASRKLADIGAGSVVAAAGAWVGYTRPDQGLSYEAWVQVLLVAGLVLAFPLVSRPKGPKPRSRMNGRSIR